MPIFPARVTVEWTTTPVPLSRAVQILSSEHLLENRELRDWKATCIQPGMQLFAITKQGLIGISLSVFALWGCIGAEKKHLRLAEQDAAISMHRLAELRSNVTPVSAPAQSHRGDIVRL